jgi:DNA-binding IclR family transcriptional regulator
MHPRPAPVVDRLLDMLAIDGDGPGLTTADLAARMGKSTTAISAKLGRMRAYGYVSKTPEHNNGRHPHELNRWKLRQRR